MNKAELVASIAEKSNLTKKRRRGCFKWIY